MPTIISVEGNIGAGKSTLLKELENHGIIVFQEDLNNWGSLLERYYADPKRWMFKLQTKILLAMKEQKKKIDQINADYVIIERSPVSSFIFAKVGVELGLLDDEEFKILQGLAETLYWKPHHFVFLNVDHNLCFERVKARARKGEEAINLDYLKRLEDHHMETFVFFQQTESVLFINNPSVEKVLQFIKSLFK